MVPVNNSVRLLRLYLQMGRLLLLHCSAIGSYILRHHQWVVFLSKEPVYRRCISSDLLKLYYLQ